MILNMRSRSPKPDYFFSNSQSFISVGVVKMHPAIQKMKCSQAIYQHSCPDISRCVIVQPIDVESSLGEGGCRRAKCPEELTIRIPGFAFFSFAVFFFFFFFFFLC